MEINQAQKLFSINRKSGGQDLDICPIKVSEQICVVNCKAHAGYKII